MRCEWGQGQVWTNAATHKVYVTFPGEPTEAWLVCRPHDRELKKLAVFSRTPSHQGLILHNRRLEFNARNVAE